MRIGIKTGPTPSASALAWFATLPVALALAGCGGGDSGDSSSNANDNNTANLAPMVVANAADKCAALQGVQVPAAAIGLPTSGATLNEASLKPADSSAGLPEYCSVKGSIAATNASDPPINFQLNLPTSWNRKSLQLGGGGLNGTVVTGLDNVPNSPDTAVKPLARGYTTFGSDSGHTGKSPADGSFGTNAQALANYSGESVKRTHDAALAVATRYYQAASMKVYYAGGSKGGHEGLIAAQRYGADYDGVIAYYPANQNQAMVLSWFAMWEAAYRRSGGAMNAAKQQLLKKKVLEACDALDGVADGIVSNLKSCAATFAVNNLRCPDGTDAGDTCLSDTQISTLLTAATPMEFAFPLANGVTSIGPYPVFNGGDITGTLFDTAGTGATTYSALGDPVIRYFIQQNPAATTEGFDYRAWQPRVTQISQLYDATDPNVDAFKQKGGKLIIVQGTTDMLVTHTTTTAYVSRLSDRYGAALPSFAKYFVQPGFGHGGGDFLLKWDSLSALEAWVESGKAPADPIVVDGSAATKGRSRPLCEYPLWPKYKGSGDQNQATSFSCVNS